MFQNIRDLIEGLSHPPIRHAALVHLPIVLAMVSMVLALISAILLKNRTLRIMMIAALATVLASWWFTIGSGNEAEDAITRILPHEVHEIVEEHEDMGNALWWFAAGAMLPALVGAFTTGRVKIIAAWLTVLSSLVMVMWVGVTAHLGGTLVYRHGVGPMRESRAATPAGVPTTASSSQPDAANSSSEARVAFFRSEVEPILAQNCTKCHNSARVAAGKSGKLDQTSRQTLLAGGKNGPAIVIGKPEESLLIKRVTAPNDDEAMPPPDNRRLTPHEIAALEQWIRDGATWGQ